MSNREKPLISFVHGRHFDGSIFNALRADLKSKGFESIAPTFDVEDGSKNLDEHAKQLAEEEAATGAREVVRWMWSWGANVGIRDFGLIPIRRMGMIAGAFHRDSLAWANGDVPDTQHNVNYMAYENNPCKEAYKQIARLCLFTDLATDDQTVSGWSETMRDHPRREEEPKLNEPPAAPIDYVILTRDKAILNQDKIAEGLAKQADVQLHTLESDHVPMVSHRKELTDIIVRQAVIVRFQPISLN